MSNLRDGDLKFVIFLGLKCDRVVLDLDALTEYHELEHVKLTRDFLNNPEAFLRHL